MGVRSARAQRRLRRSGLGRGSERPPPPPHRARPGCRFPPLRAQAGARARAARLGAQPGRRGRHPRRGRGRVDRSVRRRTDARGATARPARPRAGVRCRVPCLRGFPDRRQRSWRHRAPQRRARPFRLRGLPRRDGRPRGAALPLPLHQLYPVRPALHDHRPPALRPAAHGDGRIHTVRRLPRRVRKPGRPAFSRATAGLPPVWPAARIPPAGNGTSPRQRGGTRRLHRQPARRADRRGQGDRRLPPALRRVFRRCGETPARAQAAAGQAARRSAQRRPACCRKDRAARRRRTRAAEGSAAPDRADEAVRGQPAARHSHRPRTRRGRADAALLAAAPPAARRLRRPPGRDLGQPLRRAGADRRRRSRASPREGRRRLRASRPADPPPRRRPGLPRHRRRAAATAPGPRQRAARTEAA